MSQPRQLARLGMAAQNRDRYPQILGTAYFVGCHVVGKRETVGLMTDPPTLGRPQEMPAIRNSDELCLRWRALMGPLGFGSPRLWIAFLGRDNIMSAQLTQIEDIPGRADAKVCGSLLEMCRHIVGRDGAGGSVAMLLARPGRNPMDDADRSWARCLTSAADQLKICMWPVHFANDAELRVFAPDDLVTKD
jgi:hypothetical protein